MNAQERERVWQELLELRYGCHEDPAELMARVEREPELRTLQAEMEQTVQLLEAAARAPAGNLRFTPPGPGNDDIAVNSSGPRSWWQSHPYRVAGSFILALLLLSGSFGAWQTYRARTLATQAPALVLSGPPGIPDAASGVYTVQTVNGLGAPVAAPLRWTARDEEGHQLASDAILSSGSCSIVLPASLKGARSLEVQLEGHDAPAVRLPLSPSSGAPLIHLASDKPLYRPGEVLRARAVVLDRLTLRERAGIYRLRITDARGNPATSLALILQDGVGDVTWTVPDDAPGGTWQVEVRDAQDTFTVAKLPVRIRRFEPPQLAKTVDLDRTTYAPGTEGSAELSVSRLAGGSVAGAEVNATLVLDGQQVWSEQGALDSKGRAIFRFKVPDQVSRGEARFVAAINDGSVTETAVEPFAVPTGRLAVAFYPEGGDLLAGVAARVYAEVTDSLGRPASASGRIVDGNGETIARFDTQHQGRGRFEVTAGPDDTLRLVFDEPAGTSEASLPSPRPGTVGLASHEDSFAPSAPIGVTVHAPDAGPYAVGVFCRGTLVGHTSITGAGPHDVSVMLSDNAAGVLRVTVFDRKLTPVAERLVHRRPARRIDLTVTSASKRLRPGAPQRLRVEAKDEEGRPVQAVVGLSVTDAGVRAASETTRIGLADQAWLAGDVEDLEDAEDFFVASEAGWRNVDLLLGTRGWRRFAWVDEEAFVAAHGDRARRLLSLEGRPQVPRIVDTRSALWHEAEGFRHRSEQAFGVFIATLLAALLAALLLPMLKKSSPLTTDTALAGAGLAAIVFVMVMMQPLQHRSALEAEVAKPQTFAPFIQDVDEDGTLDLSLALGDTTTGIQWGLGDINGALSYVRDFDVEIAQASILGVPGDLLLYSITDSYGEYGWAFDTANLTTEAEGIVTLDKLVLLPGLKAARLARIYAHKHEARANRHDFTETVYWNSALKTDAAGQAEVTFDVSDRVTTWEVGVDAHGAGRVGQGSVTFETRMPFHLQAKLPVEVTAGDRLLLPIGLNCSDDQVATVRVTADATGSWRRAAQAGSEPPALTPLKEGRARLQIPLEVTAQGREARILIAGQAGPWSDRVEQTVRVVPRGFPCRLARSGVLRGQEAVVLPVPASVVAGSLEVGLKLYPSPLATLTDSIEGMLREPHGCFEQASSTNYPNVLALQYLEATGDDAPALAARSRRVLSRGYDLLTGYECPKRGYEWYGADPGHTALTAYGLLEFHDMSRVHPVDAAMIERTGSWLLAQRDGRGGFENGTSGHTFGSAPGDTISAYAAYALSATGHRAGEVEKELDHVEHLCRESTDSYVVAVAACALSHAGRDEAARGGRRRLAALQSDEGFVSGGKSSITSSRGQDLLIETTAFATLAWMQDAEDAGRVQRAIGWLLEQRRGSGTFGATQATILALKALTSYAEQERPEVRPGTVRVFVGDVLVDEAAIEEGHLGVITVASLDQYLKPGENTLRLVDTAGNQIPWTLDFRYHADQPVNDPEAPLSISTSLEATALEGSPVSLRVRVENRTQEGVSSPMAVVGLPAGLEARGSVLDALKSSGRVAFWEIKGRDLIFYWRDLGPGASHDLQIDLVAHIPGTTTGPASRAWLYYAPDAVNWAPPLTVTVK